MKDLLVRWYQNKHTSGSAIGVALLTVASIWFPKYKAQLDETARALIVYGLLQAGDAQRSVQKIAKEDQPGTVVKQ